MTVAEGPVDPEPPAVPAMLSAPEYGRRSARAHELAARLREKGVRVIQMEMPDINGAVRGKIASLEKGLGPTGTGVSTLAMSFRGGEEIALSPWSNLDNGFPKFCAVPDLETVTPLPWRPDTAAVLCDFIMNDGSACVMDGREILRRAVADLAELGYTAKAALEWEFYIFESDDALLRAGRYRELKSFGRNLHCYTLTNLPSFIPLATEFVTRMESVGIPVEAFHSEYGRGQYEFTCAATDPLQAADWAVRAKTYLRELAAEHALVTTWMPVLHTETVDSNNGCHVNFSLERDGQNAFWDGTRGRLSDVAGHAAAGILATMPDFHVLFRPWVNSFRRMDRLSWNPQDASWGTDNHATAIRVVHGPDPARYTRFEHRAPGPDISPHLVLAAIVRGAALGIRAGWRPPPQAAGDPLAAGGYPMLPRTLEDSVAAMRSSPVAKDLLSPAFIEHFAVLKLDEAHAYRDWLDQHPDTSPDRVTDWEFSSYFEWV
jgi:glutamine synthetase